MNRGIVLGFLLLAGCSSLVGLVRVESPRPELQSSEPNKLTKEVAHKDSSEAFFYAMDHYKEKQWERTEQLLYSFLHMHPSSSFHIAGWIAYGECLQHLGRWEESVKAFRKVTSRPSYVRPSLMARALMAMSLSYETLNRNEKALSSLLDTEFRQESLTPLRRDILLPARLAIVYAKLGNRDRAEGYAKRSNLAVQSIRAKGFRSEKERVFFADLLYRMGRNPIHLQKDVALLDLINGLRVSQEFLLQGLETGVAPFAEDIEQDLLANYDYIVHRFSNEAAGNKKSVEGWSVSLLEAMDRFRYTKLPSQAKPIEERFTRIFDKFSAIENQVFAIIARDAVDIQRTAEDVSRDGLRREGRIIDEDILRKMRPKPYQLIDLDEELTEDPNL